MWAGWWRLIHINTHTYVCPGALRLEAETKPTTEDNRSMTETRLKHLSVHLHVLIVPCGEELLSEYIQYSQALSPPTDMGLSRLQTAPKSAKSSLAYHNYDYKPCEARDMKPGRRAHSNELNGRYMQCQTQTAKIPKPAISNGAHTGPWF